MFDSVRRMLRRRRERELERLSQQYVAMTPDEREELESVKFSGAAGKREVVVEAAARRSEALREGRPDEYLEPPAA